MFAIIKTGAKQYRAEVGAELLVERLEVESGGRHELSEVLLISDEGKLTLGHPFIPGASVVVEVVGEELADKVIAIRYKAKKDVLKRRGHRQRYTRVKVLELKSSTASTKAPQAKKARAKAA